LREDEEGIRGEGMNPASTDRSSDQGGGAKRTRTGPLSSREREVFGLLAEGLSGAQIAATLVLSPETVRTHIRNGMAKLGASTRSQAVVLALRRQEISTPPGGQAPAPAPPTSVNGALPAGHVELEPSLSSLLDGLLSLLDVEAGWIYLAEADGLTLRRAVGRSCNGGSEQPATLALGEGPIGRAALERRSQIVPARGAETGAMIVAPLLAGNRLIGALALATRSSRPTGRRELLLLQALAGRIGELVQKGGPNVASGLEQALNGFRASWSSPRPL
jgi:DNA-binding CsgD family transcriptional regulator